MAYWRVYEIGAFLASFAVTVFTTWAVLRFDEKRLDDEERARAWLPASRAIAIGVFAPLSLVVHFVRTRRSWKGALFGTLATIAVGFLADMVTWPLEGPPWNERPPPATRSVSPGPKNSAILKRHE